MKVEKLQAKKFLFPYIYTLITRTHGNSYLQRIRYYILSANLAGSTLPFFFACIFTNWLHNQSPFLDTFEYIWKYILGYAILIPLYEIGYLINDTYSVKREEKKYRTIRIDEQVAPSQYIIAQILIRFLIVFLLFIIFVPTQIKIQYLIILLMLLTIFTIHNLFRTKIERLITLPLLHFLKFSVVLSLIVQNEVEKHLMILYLFSLAIPNALIFTAAKLGGSDTALNLIKNRNEHIAWYSRFVSLSFTVLALFYTVLIVSSVDIGKLLYIISYVVFIDIFYAFAMIISKRWRINEDDFC